MLSLGINTAVQPFGIGLSENNTVLFDQHLSQSFSVTENLILHIDQLCQNANKRIDDITSIGVCHGPGGYTGLRLGVTVAKTLAQHLNIQAQGISTLEAVAQQVAIQSGVYAILLPGSKKDVNAALFTQDNTTLSRLTPDFVWDFETVAKQLQKFTEPITIAGQWPEALNDTIENSIHSATPIAISPSTIAKLAENTPQNKTQPLKVHYSHMPNIGKKKV